MCAGDGQDIVNTVCVWSEGHEGIPIRSCEVISTASANECDQILHNGPPEKNCSGSPEGTAFHGDGDQLLSRYWELEESTGQIEDVQGRLISCLSFWKKELDPAPWILNCIEEGYKLPLRLVPDKFCKPNQQSALSNTKFVNEALTTLEYNRCIQRVAHQPQICSPLSVVDNGSLHSMCLMCSHLAWQLHAMHSLSCFVHLLSTGGGKAYGPYCTWTMELWLYLAGKLPGWLVNKLGGTWLKLA